MRSRLSVKIITILLVLLSLFLFFLSRKQSPLSASKIQRSSASQSLFIKEIAPTVQKVAKSYGVKPSVVIGQAVLETKYGASLLMKRYHNLFSLRAVAGQEDVTLLKDVYASGSWINRPERFVIYSNQTESIYDYLDALKNARFWDEELYRQLVSNQSYEDDAKSLQDYYFSSDPNYATKLVKIIKKNQLTQYDN